MTNRERAREHTQKSYVDIQKCILAGIWCYYTFLCRRNDTSSKHRQPSHLAARYSVQHCSLCTPSHQKDWLHSVLNEESSSLAEWRVFPGIDSAGKKWPIRILFSFLSMPHQGKALRVIESLWIILEKIRIDYHNSEMSKTSRMKAIVSDGRRNFFKTVCTK